MKSLPDSLYSKLPKQILLALALVVILCVAVDSALHASHVMVFFSLILLSALFFTLYVESEKHRLGVSIACLVLGSVYLAFYPIDFTWWRFSVYSGALYLAAILLFASWLALKHWRHSHNH